jgi:hypothetical protein
LAAIERGVARTAGGFGGAEGPGRIEIKESEIGETAGRNGCNDAAMRGLDKAVV